MTEAQVNLVKRSWSLVREIDPALVGDVFYSKLFLKMPSLKKMFPASMDEQYKKIIDTLSMIVSRLDRLDEVTDELKKMAIRHVLYGVKTWHYEVVGESLLWTLEQGLGSDWTPEVKEAWSECYNILSNTMIDASVTEK